MKRIQFLLDQLLSYCFNKRQRTIIQYHEDHTPKEIWIELFPSVRIAVKRGDHEYDVAGKWDVSYIFDTKGKIISRKRLLSTFKEKGQVIIGDPEVRSLRWGNHLEIIG